MNCTADIGAPSGCQKLVTIHVLDGTLFAVGEFDLHPLFLANARALAALLAWLGRTFTGLLATLGTGFRRRHFTHARLRPART